ncbi:hypothetical protein DSCO28_55420 [Desulfosarcina ovata subsp. sediminis]|uniref:EamA domain-containing protein n=1 Tax=Desulfosarcina ovata subsp. sediminis TaxID=885957 RepID=A0A5K7ZXU3_9BACT|nr:DMT family transporter [Desulfosarcina ovata]BBO84976.1 hypothetical protein DSCO28_55420 [Desulfosarcina ovata subsp. sediminis]
MISSHPNRSNTGTGVTLAFICLIILGTLPVVSNSRPPGTSALAFAFFLSVWQLIFSLPLFIHELISGRRGLFGMEGGSRERGRVAAVAVVTGIMFGLATWCYVLSMEKAGAVSASIAIQTYPLFAILVEMVLIRQGKSFLELALTLGLVLDLYYLGTGGTWQLAGISAWFLAALGVPLLWSIAHVLIREELTTTPITPAQVTFFRVLLSAVFLGAVMGGTGDGGRFFDTMPYAAAMGCLYYLELLVWFHAVRHINISLASAVTTPWPAVTMVLAALFLGDKIQGYQVTAFFIAVGCVGALLAAGAARNRSR